VSFVESPRVIVHATCIALGGCAHPFGGPEDAAVLIFGAPGSGKSDLALRLIAAGAKLVADDQTSLSVDSGKLWAEAPQTTRGLMEIHGVGILAVDSLARGAVVLAVRLERGHKNVRLPEPSTYVAPHPLKPRIEPVFIVLDPFEASAPAKLAAAACGAASGRFVAGAGEAKP
jgi:HPr kinase/phosphorylase